MKKKSFVWPKNLTGLCFSQPRGRIIGPLFFFLAHYQNAAPRSEIPPHAAFGSQIRQKNCQVHPADNSPVSLAVYGTHAMLGPTYPPRSFGCSCYQETINNSLSSPYPGIENFMSIRPCIVIVSGLDSLHLNTFSMQTESIWISLEIGGRKCL